MLTAMPKPLCPDVSELTARIHSEHPIYKGAYFSGFFCYVTIGGIMLRSQLQRPAPNGEPRTLDATFEAILDDARVLHAQAGFTTIFAAHDTLHGSEYNDLVLCLTDRAEWQVPVKMAHLYPAAAFSRDTDAEGKTE